jgi:type IV pilus assembly protein PilC
MKGTIEATTNEEAKELLNQMQLDVNSVEKARTKKPKTAIGRSEFVLFNQQLASITKAGIPLERGLRELAGDIQSRSMRKLVDAIADELEAGVSIEQAFEKRQKHFPPLYGRILKAGVETGRLSEMLTSLNRHLDMANQTRRIIFEAMTYPVVILVLASIILTGVFLFIIPQFESVLEEISGGQLPALTRLFLNMSQNVIPFWTVVGLMIVAIVVLYMVLSASAVGRRFKESLLLKIPVIGRVYHSSVLSRMAEGMAIMVAAGSDMPVSLRLSSGVTGSGMLMLENDVLAGQIEQGANILEAGQFCQMIPRLFLYSIQLGTQRNELQDNLYSLGQMYAEQARCGQARLQAVLLPVMLIGVGCFIATTILAMFLPMIGIITNLTVV